MTDQAPLILCSIAGGHWSVTESSWSPWEPSSSARPQPTPFLWISWHNHCLPGNTQPWPLDPEAYLSELWGHPKYIIPAGGMATGHPFPETVLGRNPPIFVDSSIPASFLLFSPSSAWMVARVSCHRGVFSPHTSQLLHA
jgi:hypothetical protein